MLRIAYISLIMTLSQAPHVYIVEKADDYRTGPNKCEVVSVDLDQETGLCMTGEFEYLCKLRDNESHEPRVHPSLDVLKGYPRRKERGPI